MLPLALVMGWAAAAEPQGGAQPENKLVGTWKHVPAKPGGPTTLKHVTPTQFMWVTYGRDGTVTRAGGGNYKLKGDVYEETPEYGLGASFEAVKGQTHAFKWRVEGDKWYHSGKLANGLEINEVWERVAKK